MTRNWCIDDEETGLEISEIRIYINNADDREEWGFFLAETMSFQIVSETIGTNL